MDIFSITHPKVKAFEYHRASTLCLTRWGCIVLVYHLLVSLVQGHKWTRLAWYHRGEQGRWYRYDKILEFDRWRS